MEADDLYEHDSTFGGDRASLASSSTSLQSAITAYPFENGRRYHAYKAGIYSFPNDEQELNRMDIEHQNQLLQLGGKLHLCPLKDPQEILDIGTGTGIWAMDVADLYPNAQVIGTDLSPVQPEWVPPNCRFDVDDFEQEWTFDDGRFDLIHARFLLGSVTDATELYKRVYSALKPGGYFEISDMECGVFSDDGTVKPEHACVQWGELLEEAFSRLGKPIIHCDQYEPLFKAAGFENVQSTILKRPINDWPKDPRMKDVGRYSCLNFLEGIEGFTIAPFTRLLGWTNEEVQVFLADVRKETVTRRIHGWQKA
ncbi:S-adenosyl-L-methionine-dependent methyltransferase [Polychaeton citri CBS 116435]|uniref:S-adenosyl-L-methionine-dependent methyltransferase n=1 Tax=Polychaeton citri CBS 116435 TaxID=1314669 RepID=A0A9P4QCB9_9PEZI|nr:S-adenosyl-L-methionine-dependent methyltransferase [Polychaeton citri CBS 116435]